MSDNSDEQMIPTPSDFGHFVLEKELGHGGMGGVYLARDKMLDRKVAIKVMLKSLGDDPAFVERFQREAQAAARLNHPNIAQIYSFGQENGMPYIAMELVGGGSLDREMDGHLGLLDPTHIMKIGYQVAEALATAAEQNLVHGDVKPENILYDLDGNAKLVDFGLAAMQGTDEIWGTPYYISPEKVRRQKTDFRADIYSLGGTLYHAITGVAPFEGIDATQVVRARFETDPRLPSTIRPELPKEIDAILMRMLQREPAMRYPTYQSLLGDFKRFLQKAVADRSSRSKLKLATKKTHIKIASTGKPMKVTQRVGEESSEPGSTPMSSVKPLVQPQKGVNVGRAVGVTVAAIIVAIVAVVGGLIWYVDADKKGKARAEQAQRDRNCQQARNAIAGTLAAAEKFVKNFDEFVTTADRNMLSAQREMKSRLNKSMLAQASALMNPPVAKEIAEAIAYTNKLLAVKEEPKADDAAKKDEAKKSDAAAKDVKGAKTADAKDAKTADAKDAKKPDDKKDAKKAVAKTNDEADAEKAMAEQEARLSGKPLPKDDKKAEAKEAAKPEADKKDEAAAVAEAVEKAKKVAAAIAPNAKVEVQVIKMDLPPAVRELAELWPDVYTCRAALIRVKGHFVLVKRIADKAETITGNDAQAEAELAKLSQEILDEHERMKGLKSVEQTQRKAGIIREKSKRLLDQAIGQIVAATKKYEAETIKAKEKAEKDAKDAAAAKRKAELKVSEPKQAKEKFNALVGSRLKNLDWEPALKQLRPLLDSFETDEGRAEARSQIEKVECMQALHQAFIKFGKGFKFKDGTSIKAVDEKAISIQNIKYVKGHAEKGKVDVIEWTRFYGKPEYVKMMNQMLNTLVIKGRDTTRVGPLQWSREMLGAALTLELLYTDVPGAAEMVPVFVKKCTKEFSDSARWAKLWFPKVEIEVAVE